MFLLEQKELSQSRENLVYSTDFGSSNDLSVI